ncbi:DMSO reductase anchor subunit [Palleronia marisminoris]|uniref:DMSO reductase anchor subunit (DmsC) n=1 Tax=Palleronia marisminoris TaxID=315423 RepID=A0A1Y5RHP9_9RHOB|nr:DmsC/YnfH family molybdoenzyme membrane anchor subunit [Palleronia marisminoris]SFG22503.1 DMSO reductase anchor subunit [Palleronia marisminoris]SLN17757.1 DMSO reductase anchor subunit (DmsC) [Palleronia marisminoris]
MHPAASLILFSTLSGAGFGLLALIGAGLARTTGWAGLAEAALAFALAIAGLAASTFHLGRPERALKAFREWRSSWLSREAWLAAATLSIMAITTLIRLAGLPALPLGLVGSALALATVAATAMIYAQLRTVPRWNHWTTPAIFLGHALTAGTLLAGHRLPAAILLAALAVAQFAAWHAGDRRTGATTRESATGLGPRVRPFEAPHTSDNYLTREMVFVVARKHRVRLRSIGLVLAYLAPLACLAIPPAPLALPLAALLHIGGTLIVRWLFFADAEHTVALYYR